MISSASNRQVKDVQKLQKSARFRHEQQLYVVEGWRMVEEIPPDKLFKIYVGVSYLDKLNTETLYTDLKIETVTDQVLKSMSTEKTNQGVLALVKMNTQALDFVFKAQPLLVALDCVQDPGNLGTIIRTAEAAGVDQIILSKGTVDLYNPKVIKSTMGAIFRMNICKEVELKDYISKAKDAGVRVYTAHLAGERHHFEENYTEGTCFLLGNEGNGVSDEISALATDFIKIPMTDQAESLNVAMASGILIYEAIRQRIQRL